MRIVPVDDYTIEEVSNAIELLTAPMEKGVKEKLDSSQAIKLYRLIRQLDTWVKEHQ